MKNWLGRLFGHAEKAGAEPAAAAAPGTPARHAESGVALDVDDLFCRYLLNIEDAASGASEAEKRLLRALERVLALDDAAAAELVPRMPAVIPMLLQSLREKNVSNQQLSQQISQDPVLVGAVLQQANSSYYRRATPVASIEQALAMLGQNNLRILVASVAFKPVINIQSGHFTRLAAPRIWDVQGKYAMVCRSLAARVGAEPFEPFLAGLLLYVGLIAALRVMDQVYGEQDTLQSREFTAGLVRLARALSRRIGRQWQFPPGVLEALEVQDEAGLSAAGRVLYFADRISKLRALVANGRLPEDDAAGWIAIAGMRGCAEGYLELVESEGGASGLLKEE